MKEALRSMTEDMMAMIRRKDFAPFNLALSGGETAKHMFSLWVDEYKDKIDWNNIRFFWVDERCVHQRVRIVITVMRIICFLSLCVSRRINPPDQGRERAGYRGDALFMGRKGILAVVQSNAYVRLHHPRRR